MDNLNKFRQKIDHLDQEIIHLINERVQIALQIGKVKKELGLPIHNPVREQEVITKILTQKSQNIVEQDLAAIYQAIITACKNSQLNILETNNK
jgi:chorismate mutase / prephenate dehydratase